MNKIHLCITMSILFLWVFNPNLSRSQSAVSVGSGSYAAYPPLHEYIGGQSNNGTFYDFATNSADIDVTSSKINEPIPTNDWWTSILTQEDDNGNRHGGNLWTYPLLSRFTTNGFEVGNRIGKWTSDDLSVSVSVDYLVSLTGSSFSPTKSIAMNWSDWHVDLRTQVGDNSSNRIDVTLAQGMPFVWAKTSGFDPIVQAIHAGVRTYYNASGSVQSFPATIDRLVIEYDGQLYGVHLSESVTIQETSEGLSLTGYDNKWVVFSALNSISDINTLHTHAFVRPTDTSLDYVYNPNQGSVTATYNVTTSIIAGNETNVLQGFIPHHYRGNANIFTFRNGLDYVGTPRGTLKLAEGTSFTFDYEFNADFLPHFNEPETLNSESIPYDDAKMKSMIDAYAADVDFYGIGGGTYWGGKFLLRAMKYTLMAKETGNSNYPALLAAVKARVYDWLTYTPGETENYYSYYPAWKALVGFNEEYYSAYFTDNHFHYGYLAHSAALLEIAEPGSMDGYWDMLTKVIKTYANWDKSDAEYPYLRTFSPWMGHSFASGLGNSIGNNQESSSEAMQAWAGMFMTAEMTGNTDMRDAAAFGYLTEGRAIADYWYNESGVFNEVGYTAPITGILEMNRYVYGTFFGAQETYIHGIQWLPITPAYGFWNDFLTTSEVSALVDPIMNNMATDLGGSISADWMNVSMGFKLFFDPESVVSQFDGYWNSTAGSDEYQVAHNTGENGLTYYYAHASQNIGIRQSDYRLSMPLSSAFLKNGQMTYVVYNPSGATETCYIYQNNNLVTSFSVPANSLVTTTGANVPSNLPSPWATADVGSVAATGSASYSGTTFTIDGSGSDIWNTSDEFRYVYQSLDGDGEIIAQVNSITNTNAWAKAGVMIRESLDANATHASTVVTPSNGVSFQRRTTTASSSASTSVAGQSAPKWVRVVRAGNTFSSYYSDNGINWTQVGSDVTIAMASSVYVGLCVTSHNDGTLTTASINNVSINGGAIPIDDNLALSGTASQSTTGFGGLAARAIDDDTNGQWGNGSVTHTNVGVGQWWKVDLASTQAIGEIVISNRTDCCSSRLDDITVSVENLSGTVLWSQDVTSSSAQTLTLDVGGTSGSVVRITQNQNVALSLAEVEVYASSGGSAPGKIEAEDYDAMSGVQTESTTDTGGGTNVGWIDAGDWMEYDVNIPSNGTYTVNYRVSSLSSGGMIQLQSNGSILATTTVPATGGWQVWTTVSSTVSLSAGAQTIRLNAISSGWNINWLEIVSGSSARSITDSTGSVLIDGIDSQISLYPNPAANVINIRGIEEGQAVEVYNILGHLVKNTKSTQIDITDLNAGIYFITTRGLNQPIRFIKQ